MSMALSISDGVRALMRPTAAALEPYDPSFSQVSINLSANENTHPLPDGVREAIDVALAQTPTNRYPIAMSDHLRELIATWHGVTKDQVIVGNGGDELLFNLFLAFGGKGREVLTCSPSFSVYDLYAGLLESPVREVWRDPETYRVDEAATLAAAKDANIVVVTSPNNPTGDLVSREFVAQLCEACPGIVLADEAYIEFAGPDASSEPLLERYGNLAVLHTLSKAYQLAGGRLGYVLASPSIIAALAAVRQPYSVNVFTQAAAAAIIERRAAFEPSIAAICEERERLFGLLQGLSGLGVEVWHSSANFLLVRLPHAGEVRARLRDGFSILVRDFSTAPGLADCLRISVGMPEEDDAVIKALTTILKGE